MRTKNLLIFAACAGILGSCAAAPPKELVDARAAYQRASTGVAAEVAPAEVHVARKALAQAEFSFSENPESYMTKDLAYVAQRKAQLAEAIASIKIEKRNQAQAKEEFQTVQGQVVARTKEDLDQTQKELAASKSSGDATAQALATEQSARSDAEQRAALAQAALAELAAVKDEPRGTVITLSGSVLFASNEATLLPAARARLDQVAEVLLTTPERSLIIEGHTDSQGSDSHNNDLSTRRANAVRDYLVQRGYQPNRIQSNGLGEGQPVADNSNAEGRANNRRVEIVIERPMYSATR